jgi:peroxisomal coenzyme A diphosphatase NUDT7
VIVFLTNLSVLDNLKASEAEVEHLFDHPLEAVLDPLLASKELLVAVGSEDWPYDVEYHVSLCRSDTSMFSIHSQNSSDTLLPWLGGAVYRMHRFRSTASPVKGLTADILVCFICSSAVLPSPWLNGAIDSQIRTAEVAYGKGPTYERYSSTQPVGFASIHRLLATSAADVVDTGQLNTN